MFFDRVDVILPSHSGLYHSAEFYSVRQNGELDADGKPVLLNYSHCHIAAGTSTSIAIAYRSHFPAGMEYKRQSHTSQALIHMLIIVCICLTFAKEVQQSSNEPIAESALPSRHFQFRNALEVVARLSLQMECVPNQLATENPSVSIYILLYN